MFRYSATDPVRNHRLVVHGELAGHQGGAPGVAVVEEFQEVATKKAYGVDRDFIVRGIRAGSGRARTADENIGE